MFCSSRNVSPTTGKVPVTSQGTDEGGEVPETPRSIRPPVELSPGDAGQLESTMAMRMETRIALSARRSLGCMVRPGDLPRMSEGDGEPFAQGVLMGSQAVIGADIFRGARGQPSQSSGSPSRRATADDNQP